MCIRDRTLAETKRYIERRLEIAAGDTQPAAVFPEATIAAVHRHSKGLPRLINTICENALMAAYARQVPIVTPDIIEYVAGELRLNIVSSTNGKSTNGSGEMDVKRAINVPVSYTHLDVYKRQEHLIAHRHSSSFSSGSLCNRAR